MACGPPADCIFLWRLSCYIVVGARRAFRRTLLVLGHGLCELDLGFAQSLFGVRHCHGDLAQRSNTPDGRGDSRRCCGDSGGARRTRSCKSQRVYTRRLWIPGRGDPGTIRALVSKFVPASPLNGQIMIAYADAAAFDASNAGQLRSACEGTAGL